MSEDVKHTFAWTIERFSERQEQNSQVTSVTIFLSTLTYDMLFAVSLVQQVHHPRS